MRHRQTEWEVFLDDLDNSTIQMRIFLDKLITEDTYLSDREQAEVRLHKSMKGLKPI